MNLSRAIFSAMLLLCMALPLRAYAGPPGQGDDRPQVSKLIDQAEAAIAKGNKQAAYDAYVAAWALQKSFDIAGNAGSLALKLGKLPEAARYLTYSVRNFPPTGDPAQLAILKEKQARALQAVGRLRGQVSVPGAALTLDGAVIAPEETRADLFVTPGTHVLRATANGYVEAQATVEAAAGALQDVTLTLVPVPPPRRSVVPGAVLGGVAGAALITGIGLLVGTYAKVTSSRDLHAEIAQADHTCTPRASNYDTRCAELASTSSDAKAFRNAGVGVLIGAGAAAVGAVTYFAWPRRNGPEASLPLRVSPAAYGRGAGMLVEGTF
jgi:hypothetical protein